MKIRAYVRIGEYTKADGQHFKVTASEHPNKEPLKRGPQVLPTAAFAVDFDVPESQFKMAERVLAEIKVAESTEAIAGEVTYIE